MQSKIFRKQDESCNLWLRQNLTPRKTASVMTILEQMVKTKSWKASRGLAECNQCRLCGQQKEAVEHLLTRCKVLANSEYRGGSRTAATSKMEHFLIIVNGF